MASLFEGNCIGKAVDVEIGLDNNKPPKPRVRWNMEVTEGPHAGKKASYSGKLDSDNIKYTKRDMMALGWDGKDAAGTFVAQVTQSAKAVPFVAEIARWTRDDGKVSEWTSAKSIGFTAQPLAALPPDRAKDVNSWFDEVPSGPAASSGRANDDLPF